eukprot:849107-Karenia_brevis.AAC.1
MQGTRGRHPRQPRHMSEIELLLYLPIGAAGTNETKQPLPGSSYAGTSHTDFSHKTPMMAS